MISEGDLAGSDDKSVHDLDNDSRKSDEVLDFHMSADVMDDVPEERAGYEGSG